MPQVKSAMTIAYAGGELKCSSKEIDLIEEAVAARVVVLQEKAGLTNLPHRAGLLLKRIEQLKADVYRKEREQAKGRDYTMRQGRKRALEMLPIEPDNRLNGVALAEGEELLVAFPNKTNRNVKVTVKESNAFFITKVCGLDVSVPLHGLSAVRI